MSGSRYWYAKDERLWYSHSLVFSGSRSQASRTYLEKHLDELDGAHVEKVRLDFIFTDGIPHTNAGLLSYFASAEGGVSKWRSRCFVLHSGHRHTRWF